MWVSSGPGFLQVMGAHSPWNCHRSLLQDAGAFYFWDLLFGAIPIKKGRVCIVFVIVCVHRIFSSDMNLDVMKCG
jgi:hypothetical protein